MGHTHGGADTTADTDTRADTDGADPARATATADPQEATRGSGDAGNETGSESRSDEESDTAPQSPASATHAGGPGNAASGTAAPRPVNPGKPLVQVLIPFTALLGADDQPCELVGHGPITADQARDIAADAVLKRLVYDPLSGTVLDHGRTTYRPPAGLADHVRARDVYCRGAICRRRALDGHLDHITPYPQGPTNEPNLHGCCGHEHQMKHAPGWAVRALPDGRIQWITPTGHRYHSEPYDYRTDDDLPSDKATARKGLPKDLAARLERIERNRRATARWDGQPVPEEDDDGPPPF